MNEEFIHIKSPEIHKWFEEYKNHVNVDETTADFDETKIIEPFVDMERACSSIDKTIIDIEAILKKTVQNIDKVANHTTSCQFYATAALISVNNISTINQKETPSFLSYIIEMAHFASNWLFAFIGV